MPILNQPFQGQFGDELIHKIDHGNYSNLTIFSAFAKNSGVLRLKPTLEKFKKASGHIIAFIGVDLDGTSYEALLNLFNLCDELYVIHSENMSTTYHSKIYLLESATDAWCAIGSNNLTGGGLWTNFESTSIQEYSLPTQKSELDNIYQIIEQYSDASYTCSKKITSIDDINALLDSDYISKEVSQKITSLQRRPAGKANPPKKPLFGSEQISIPLVVTVHNKRKPLSRENDNILPAGNTIGGASTTVPAFTNEQFWFEMRLSTGGSRNILDLSKVGRIRKGSVAGTPYAYKDSNHMYGGVKFFEIDPDDTTIEKKITINYLGNDYYPSTIKFTSDNGSWRIQLTGKSSDGTGELSKFGSLGAFKSQILIFEKITPDYYVLSLLAKNELDSIKLLSHVWATNGSRLTSKAYGML